MPLNSTEARTLKLDALPKFYRNKPHDLDLYGYASHIPISDRGGSHMLLLNSSWHDQYARQIERRISSEPIFEDEEPLSAERIAEMQDLIEQIKCVAALTRLVEQGVSNPRLAINQSTPMIPLNEFVQQHPYFYITGRQAGHEGKDPRYVAKLEEVVDHGYDYASRDITAELIVSDQNGDRGHFPNDTKTWSLAHLATSHMVHITRTFPYLNDGHR